TCRDCSDRGRDTARNKKQNEKENTHDGDLEDEEAGKGLAVLPLNEFLDALTQQDDNLELEARVDITSIS
ncbi:hypothetical protein B0H13DRAFT_1575736, partial [Mycena leptocephala]